MATMLERMVGAAKFDAAIYEEVEADRSALGQAMTVVVLSALAAGIGGSARGGFGFIVSLLTALVSWFVWAGVIYVVGAKLLPEPGTDADLGQLLRTIGFAASPGVLQVVGIIPGVGWVLTVMVSIWVLLATIVAVQFALDYRSVGRAVVVCVLGFVLYWVIGITVMMTAGLGAAVFRSLAGSGPTP